METDCPTCEGATVVPDVDGTGTETCPTCEGLGIITTEES